MSNPKEKAARKPKPRWLKVVLKTFRLLTVPAICIVALWSGLYIGYTVIGEQPPDDVWDWYTWRRLYDLVFAD